MQRNDVVLNITTCMQQLGYILDQKKQTHTHTHTQKGKPTQLPFLKSWEQKTRVSGAKVVPWTCTPALGTTKGPAGRLSHACDLTPTHLSPPHVKRDLHPPRACPVLCSCVPAPPQPSCSRAPENPCLNFLSGLWSTSIDQGMLRTLAGIIWGMKIPQDIWHGQNTK